MSTRTRSNRKPGETNNSGEVIAWIGVIGVIIAAIIGCLGTIFSTITPIQATQTAEAKLTFAPTPTTSTTPSPFPSSTPTPVSTTPLTPSSPTQPTSTLTLEPPTVTASPTPTTDPYLAKGDCDQYAPPCNYRVRAGDYYRLIAYDLYKDANLAVVLMNHNRDEQGYYRELRRGDFIYIPALDSLPLLSYPMCGTGKLPCQYRAYRGDTYEAIAQDFYSNTAQADLIRQANQEYATSSVELEPLVIQEGTIIIVPVKKNQ